MMLFRVGIVLVLFLLSTSAPSWALGLDDSSVLQDLVDSSLVACLEVIEGE